jgi:hypothetical protein
MSLLLAQSGHAVAVPQCPLLGEKQTSRNVTMFGIWPKASATEATTNGERRLRIFFRDFLNPASNFSNFAG